MATLAEAFPGPDTASCIWLAGIKMVMLVCCWLCLIVTSAQTGAQPAQFNGILIVEFRAVHFLNISQVVYCIFNHLYI